ncbi:MAG: adenylosuccinate lyase [Caldisphaeraceae archaeon]|nr:adenylosuccinate lyase [Caldisphaeraceae archaeon]
MPCKDYACVFEWRYGSAEMRGLFSRDNIVETMKFVEVALAEALGEAGVAPPSVAEELKVAAEKVTAEMVYEEEKRTGHDIAALVFLLGRFSSKEASRWVHFGATSYDIVDTAWAVILREAIGIVKEKLKMIAERLSSIALKDLPMPGRTHGQHATPITLGFKVANYIYELGRSYGRICDLEKRLLLVKLGGATGTMASWGEKGLKVREGVAKKLGIGYHIISTQVAPRDGIAELISSFAILASQLERFAVEVRELARPEIGELWEERGERIGSSAMPHKANPVTAERISGLSRILRSLASGAFENIILWHERDLSNSSFERFLLPHSFLIMDQILEDMIGLLDRLAYDPERMRINLHAANDIEMAEALMNELILAGLTREEAYNASKEASRIALEKGLRLWEAACSINKVRELLGCDSLKRVLNPEGYVGLSERLAKDAIKYFNEQARKC